MTDSQSGKRPRSDKPSTIRLVIRAEILPDEPAPAPARQHANWRVWAVISGAIIAATIVGIFVFRSAPEDAAPVSPQTEPPAASAAGVKEQPPEAPASTSAPAADASPPEEAPTTAVRQVLPDPSQSALQTIRGTVRVSIRVTIDNEGAVSAAVPEDPGPSRYFERLSLEAARQWQFLPTVGTEPRSRLLRFHFTREGTTVFVDD